MKQLVYALLFILLLPIANAEIATVKGIVLDSLDNLVGYADIKLDCIEDQTFSTDKFGTFMIKDVPVGECKVYANYKDAIGFRNITIKLNQTSDIEIKLDKTIINVTMEKSYFGLSLLLLIFIILIVYFIFRKNKTKKPKKPKDKKIRRVADIMKTLNSKEQHIANLLLEKKSMGQANIRHELKIPRTTLSRLLQSLEKKNIVEIEKSGKVVNVKLTNWFLGQK